MDQSSNDERVQQYAEALIKADPDRGGALVVTEFDAELASAAMEVADAEQEYLRHVEFVHAGCQGLRERDNAYLIARAEAAEAKVAAIEKYAAELEALGVVSVYESAMEIGQIINYVLNGGHLESV